ncbi:MAG: hypothetical protein O3C15_09120 [Proteobacteria bacterium]|nr:hypothetical protein [Pseudomonadota bacterium]
MLSAAVLIDLPSFFLVMVPALIAPLILHARLQPAMTLASGLCLPVGCIGAQIGVIQIIMNLTESSLLPFAMVICVLTMLYAALLYFFLSAVYSQEVTLTEAPSGGRRLVAIAVCLGPFIWGALAGGSAGDFWNPVALTALVGGFTLCSAISKWRTRRFEIFWIVKKTLVLSALGSTAGLLMAISDYDNPGNMGPALAFAIFLSSYATVLYVLAKFFPDDWGAVTNFRNEFGWSEFMLVGFISTIAPVLIIGLVL